MRWPPARATGSRRPRAGAVARLPGAGARLRGAGAGDHPRRSRAGGSLQTGGEGGGDGRTLGPWRGRCFFDEAIALYSELGDVASAGRVTAQSLRPLRSLDRTGEAAERSEAALAELGDDGDERVRGEIYRSLAEVRWAMGSLDEALVWTERGLTLAEKLDLPELFTGALGIRAAVSFRMGRRREATIANEGVLAFAEESGHQRDVALALLTRGIFLVEDDPIGAMRAEFESAEAARKAGSRPLEIIALANGVEFSVDLGRWKEADEALATLAGMEVTGAFGDGVEMSAALLAAMRGDLAEADARLDAINCAGDDRRRRDPHVVPAAQVGGGTPSAETWSARTTSAWRRCPPTPPG